MDWRCCSQGEDRVWKVEPSGRLRLLASGGFFRDASRDDGVAAVEAWLGDAADVAVAADGSVFVSATCRVRRIAPDGRIWTVAGPRGEDACEGEGDGGPARIGAGRLALSPRGILVADGCRVREIGPDGVPRTMAGRQRCRYGEAPARTFTHFTEAIIGLAAAPDGGRIVLDGVALWRVHPDGRVSELLARGRTSFDAVETLPDGTVLLGGLGGRLLRVGLDGRVQPLTGADSALASAFDGDAQALGGAFAVGDLAVAADGGWLAAQGDRIRYIAPEQSALLALGIAVDTIRPRLPLRVSLAITAPARVTLEARVRGRRTGAVTVDLPAGRSTVTLPGASARELTVTTATATAQERVTRDRLGVLAGGALTLRVAREVMARWEAFSRQIGGGGHRADCRRFGPRRIDCASFNELCQFVVSFRLRRDGILTGRNYRRERGSRCHFHAQPRWDGARFGVELPLT